MLFTDSSGKTPTDKVTSSYPSTSSSSRSVKVTDCEYEDLLANAIALERHFSMGAANEEETEPRGVVETLAGFLVAAPVVDAEPETLCSTCEIKRSVYCEKT